MSKIIGTVLALHEEDVVIHTKDIVVEVTDFCRDGAVELAYDLPDEDGNVIRYYLRVRLADVVAAGMALTGSTTSGVEQP